MSLLFRERSQTRGLGDTLTQLVPARSLYQNVGSVPVNNDTALRHSAVWACLRLRSNLISTMPLDTFRMVNGIQIDAPDAAIVANPGGPNVPRHEWLQASQVDLDRTGNAFGVIRSRDGFGNPSQVDLVPYDQVFLRIKGPLITEVKVGGDPLAVADLWHERQFVLPGVPVGLSAVAYAAMSIGGYLSAQQFALDWFGSGAHPSGQLQNTQEETLSQDVIQVAKARFKAAAMSRDIFVSGKDWVYTPAASDAAQAAFLDEMRYGVSDVCRFFDVPADIIGANDSGSSVTYANITQRNLQLLIMHLGPSLIRRENALSAVTSARTFVKFNTDALLRMDPAGVTANLSAQVTSRLRTPTEARGLLNLPPLTEADCMEFDRLFPPKLGAGMAPAGSVPLPTQTPQEPT